MRTSVIVVLLSLVAQVSVQSPLFAQQANEAQNLRQTIEEQQKRLDAQQGQLQEQEKALQQLRQRVEELEGDTQPAATFQRSGVGSSSVPTSSGAEELDKAITAAEEEWPGSFEVQAVNTRFKLSGFVELDVMHDSGAIGTPSAFVTSAIVTGNASPAQGADGETNFSVQPTRLVLETRTLLQDRRLSTFISVDFFGDFSSTTPELRLRQAYGEVTNILLGGDLLLGQAWATYTNLYSIPNTLDFETPNAVFGFRHPMVRWTKAFGDQGWTLKLAAEAPDNRNFEGAEAVSQWPDGVVAVGWERGLFNVQGSLLARDLCGSGGGQPATCSFGWGTSVQGRIHMPGNWKQDFWSLSLTYGEGIGGALNDAPPDATFNAATNELETIPTTAWVIGYQHWWNPKFYSVVSYGEVMQDNRNIQASSAYKKTQYTSANVTWTPYHSWLFGFEVLYGTREDNNGAKGHDFRTLFVSRFSF